VASANMNDFRTNNSAFGNCVDIFAPGGLIPSESLQDPNGQRVTSGTSMAAAHVSGVVALYLQKNPFAKPVEVMSALRAGAIPNIVTNAQSANGNLLVNTRFLEDVPAVNQNSTLVATPAPFVATEVPGRANRLFASRSDSLFLLQWSAPANLDKSGPVTYRLEGSTDNRRWQVLHAAATETQAVAPVLRFYRVTPIGALGPGPVGQTVMIGLR